MEPKLLIKITNRSVGKLVPPERGYIIGWDRSLKGFGCRVTAAGVRSFILNYRINGAEKRLTLGRYGALSADQARELAAAWLAGVSKGVDPARERHDRTNRPLFFEVAEWYIERHAKPRKSPTAAKEDERKLRSALIPLWGRKHAEDIGQLDIVKPHNRLKDEIGHHTANRYLALLGKLFTLSIEWGVRSDNPARGIKTFPEVKRDRWLRPDEIRSMFESLAQEPDSIIRGALTFILLTGARRNEALAAKWSDIDFDAALWRISETKSGKPQTIPLSGHAMGVLQSLPRIERCPWIFPGRVWGESLANLNRPWLRVRKRAGLHDVRIHDLRRSLGSLMVQGGASLYVTQRALRHSDSRVTAEVYSHLDDDTLRAAFEVVGEKVAALNLDPQRKFELARDQCGLLES